MKKAIIILLCIVILPWFGSQIHAQSEFTKKTIAVYESTVDTVVVINGAKDSKETRTLALQKAIRAALEALDTKYNMTLDVMDKSVVISDDGEEEYFTSTTQQREDITLVIHLFTGYLEDSNNNDYEYDVLSKCKVVGTRKKKVMIMDGYYRN